MLALLLLTAFALACWCVVRAGARGVRRIPDDERLTPRQKRALEDATRTLNRRHLRLVNPEKKP